MEFTHFDTEGNAWMVDVGGKEETSREAVARGSIFMSRECFEKVREGSMKKGDVLGVGKRATCWAWPGSPASWGPRKPLT